MKILKTLSILITIALLGYNLSAQSIQFSGPTNGQEFDAPHDLYVSVETTGNIRKVTLFLNGDRVRDEKVAPYEWGALGQNDSSLQEMTDGNYTLRAVAEVRGGDNVETTITIKVGACEGDDCNGGGENRPPTVSFSKPTDGRTFAEPADVPVTVEATDPDGKVEKVDLFLNGTLVRTEGRAPYEWGKANQSDDELRDMEAGNYTLRAVAHDDEGATGEATISFTVGDGGSDNIPPTVSITAPSNGQNFSAGNNLSVSATATDSDGNITGIELFYDDVTQGVANVAPYNWMINNLMVGSHTLRVVATDNEGGTDEAQITINVQGDGGTWQYNGSTAFYEGGFVGIGTDNPDEMLTVAGIIHSREVVVTVNAGADFVFEKDYELLPLDELAAYLEKNKHLPEIAPAKAMEKDGLALSEFNIQLLQKVEELTLYTIQLHERYKALEELVMKMQKEKSEGER